MCVGEENPPKMAKFLQRAGPGGGDICSVPALSLGSQQERSTGAGKAGWGRGEPGKGGLGGGKRSPQLLCLLTIAFPGTGLQHEQLPMCLPNFPCPADGMRTLVVGR